MHRTRFDVLRKEIIFYAVRDGRNRRQTLNCQEVRQFWVTRKDAIIPAGEIESQCGLLVCDEERSEGLSQRLAREIRVPKEIPVDDLLNAWRISANNEHDAFKSAICAGMSTMAKDYEGLDNDHHSVALPWIMCICVIISRRKQQRRLGTGRVAGPIDHRRFPGLDVRRGLRGRLSKVGTLNEDAVD
jgi:hypothetical protein